MEQRQPGEGPRLQGFSGNGFRVDGAFHAAGVLIGLEEARGWSPPSIDKLGVDDLDFLLNIKALPEFILLGTGAAIRRPAALVRAIEAIGVGVELMDSRAAARTYVMLSAEGRHIGAALYPLDA